MRPLAVRRARLALVGAAVAGVLLWTGGGAVNAQSLEPRSYSNTPVGTNFLLVGTAYSQGDVALDPSAPLKDVDAKLYSAFVGYAHTISLGGQSGQLALLVPLAHLDASGSVEEQARSVTRTGAGDLGIRLGANLYGAPALSAKEFAAYRQDTIVGVGLLITVPTGQYYSDKLVNLGTHRWSFKPEVGISKAFGNWILEGAGAATFFTTNEEFFPGASTREQAPLYSVQGHAIYTFRSGMWAALDATYYSGGRTTVNGVLNEDLQQNSRWAQRLPCLSTPGVRSSSSSARACPAASVSTSLPWSDLAVPLGRWHVAARL
jgi:hypothetical protein